MADSVFPIKINGYIRPQKTRQGFIRTRRQGFPRPLFSIESALAKKIGSLHRKLTVRLLKDVKEKIRQSGITLDGAFAADGKDEDSLESLMKFLEETDGKMRREQEEAASRAEMGSAAKSLEHEWLGEEQEETERPDGKTAGGIERIFRKEQKDFLARLLGDADGKTRRIIQSLTIDKRKFFDRNMDELRRLYVENSLERIKGEQNGIKRAILKRIADYAANRTDELSLSDLTKEAFDRGDHLARLFARDQTARLNRACALAAFRSAGATKVQWLTSNDARVRETHRRLNRKIFDIGSLPDEANDYNCRCALVPVEWSDG